MVNGRTTYGEVFDPTLGKLIGDQRVREFNSEVLTLLGLIAKQNRVRVDPGQYVRRAAGILLLAAGYAQRIGASDGYGDFFEITDAGRAALSRMYA